LNNVNVKLLVGLGNPGVEYEHTRHNVGVDFLYELASAYAITLSSENKFYGITGRGYIEGRDLRLLFPTTFMNLSGKSVLAISQFYKIRPDEILVIHDDLDLSPGFMKLKNGGGLAGHNGLKSIASCLGTQNFLRLRFGIGKPPSKDVISWVLGHPLPQDRDNIQKAYATAQKAIGVMFKDGLEKATALVNGFKI